MEATSNASNKQPNTSRSGDLSPADSSAGPALLPVRKDVALDNADGVEEEQNAPKDPCLLVYVIFFICGVAMLLPWNAIITAEAYFGLRFAGTSFAARFMNWFSVAFMFFNLMGLVLAVTGQRTIHMGTHVLSALAANILIFGFFTVTSIVDVGTPTEFFYISIILVSTSALTTAWIQNGIFGIAAQFPPLYIQAVLSGQGLAGVAVSLSQLVTTVSSAEGSDMPPEAIRSSAFYYFMFSAIIAVLTIITFQMLRNVPFYIYYTSAARTRVETTASSNSQSTSANVESASSAGPSESYSEPSQPPKYVLKGSNHGELGDGEAGGSTLRSMDDVSNLSSSPVSAGTTTSRWATIRSTSWTLRYQATASCMVFVVTLAAFPALTMSVKPVSGDKTLYSHLFSGIHYLIFNVGDWIGRLLPSMPIFRIRNRIFLVSATFLRVLFIVAFMFCNAGGSQTVFGDAAFFVILLAFAITSGWLGSTSMMAGANIVDPALSSLAGTLMSFYLTCGLFIGSVLSFVVTYLVAAATLFSRENRTNRFFSDHKRT